MNLRPSGYEPDELPGCSIPRQFVFTNTLCFGAQHTKHLKTIFWTVFHQLIEQAADFGAAEFTAMIGPSKVRLIFQELSTDSVLGADNTQCHHRRSTYVSIDQRQ